MSRTEKRELKVLKEIKRHTQKFKKQIRDTTSKQYKRLQRLKKDISALQDKRRLEQERYLDKRISEANEQRNYKKLHALIDSYQKDKPPPLDAPITCVKDKNGTMRTTTVIS